MKRILISIIIYFISNTTYCQSLFGDIDNAITLCTKDPLMIRFFNGPGKKSYEIPGSNCSNRFDEKHTAWFEWQAANNGDLAFLITPLDDNQDIDFILYERKGNERSSMNEIRCMAAGEMIGGTKERSFPCMGKTGLFQGGNDTDERDGCGEDNDNFLAYINQEKGKSYLLVINNYTSDIGIQLKMTGTAQFMMPDYKKAMVNMDDKRISIGNNITYYGALQYKQSIKSKRNPSQTIYEWQFADVLSIGEREYTFIGCKSKTNEAVIADRSNSSNSNEEIVIGEPFPNPSLENSSISITSTKKILLNMQIRDIHGRLLDIKDYNLEKGNHQLQIPIEKYVPSTYFIIMNIDKTIYSRKVVKIN